MIVFPKGFRAMTKAEFKELTDSPLSAASHAAQVKFPIQLDTEKEEVVTPLFGVFSLTENDNPNLGPIKDLVGVCFDGNEAIEKARQLADVPLDEVPETSEGNFTFYCGLDKYDNKPWFLGFVTEQLEAL